MKPAFWQRAFVWRWRGWRLAARDFALVQLGFLLFGFAINMMVMADLGLAPWLALESSLTRVLPLTLGQSIMCLSALIILLDVALRQPLGWGTLANVLCIGLWVDWVKPLTPAPLPALWFKLVYLLVSVAILGVGTALYVGVHAGAGPRDSLMLAAARRLRISVRLARFGIDVLVLLIALLLGGRIGLGTLLIALTSGLAIQASFRLLRMPPHPPEPEAITPEA